MEGMLGRIRSAIQKGGDVWSRTDQRMELELKRRLILVQIKTRRVYLTSIDRRSWHRVGGGIIGWGGASTMGGYQINESVIFDRLLICSQCVANRYHRTHSTHSTHTPRRNCDQRLLTEGRLCGNKQLSLVVKKTKCVLIPQFHHHQDGVLLALD